VLIISLLTLMVQVIMQLIILVLTLTVMVIMEPIILDLTLTLGKGKMLKMM
jgi:hypothetical protein